ncbi:MAG: ImmA/IrrE family metallo-endopeptidase [Archangium sp.]
MKAKEMSASDILRHFDIVEPSVPVFELAEMMGVEVVEEVLGHAGEIEFMGGTQPRITINSSDAEVRQRFTCAHELGHLMRHTLVGRHRDTNFTGNRVEVEANKFAASLLMPFWMLEPLVETEGPYVPYLARVFGVSERAMEIRLSMMAGR